MMVILQKLSAVKSYRRVKKLIAASFTVYIFYAGGGGGGSMNVID